MSALDKNKIFFGLIHYILSEQRNVDWILKTSINDFIGLSTTLSQASYVDDNLLNNIISYVYDVKPYHNQFSAIIEKFANDKETIVVDAEDFENVLYKIRYDATSVFVDKRCIEDVNAINSHKTVRPTITEDYMTQYLVDSEGVSETTLDIKSNTVKCKSLIEWGNTNMQNRLFVNGVQQKTVGEVVQTELGVDTIIGYVTSDGDIIDCYGNKLLKFSKPSYYIDEISGKATYRYATVYTMGEEVIGTWIESEDKLSSSYKGEIYDTNNNLLYTINETTKILPDYYKIRDLMNAFFKGKTVDGGDYDETAFGYDVWLYDEIEYDSPNIVYDYCIVKFNDTIDGKSYPRTFVKIGDDRFKVDHTGYKVQVFIKDGTTNKITQLNDFIDEDETIGSTVPLNLYDTFIVKLINPRTNIVEDIKLFYVHDFEESDSEIIHREFADWNTTMSFELPASDIDSKKYIVYKKLANGSAHMLEIGSIDSGGYQPNGNAITVSLLNENEHIQISCYDYSVLYDKLYSYEDTLGRSNNISVLEGAGFLRPLYEPDRTSELCVTYPIDGVMYKQIIKDEDGTIDHMDVLWVDHKKDMMMTRYSVPSPIKIKKIIKSPKTGVATAIQIDGDLMDTLPNRLLIGNEIIEYNELSEDNTISKLKRARLGTPLLIQTITDENNASNTHFNDLFDENTPVYLSSESVWNNLNRNEEYILKGETWNIEGLPEYNNTIGDSYYIMSENEIYAWTKENNWKKIV